MKRRLQDLSDNYVLEFLSGIKQAESQKKMQILGN